MPCVIQVLRGTLAKAFGLAILLFSPINLNPVDKYDKATQFSIQIVITDPFMNPSLEVNVDILELPRMLSCL